MRKFVVNVNGNSYEVEVEEVGGVTASAPDCNLLRPLHLLRQQPQRHLRKKTSSCTSSRSPAQSRLLRLCRELYWMLRLILVSRSNKELYLQYLKQ